MTRPSSVVPVHCLQVCAVNAAGAGLASDRVNFTVSATGKLMQSRNQNERGWERISNIKNKTKMRKLLCAS